MVMGDDLQFEPGTVVASNIFKRVSITDEFRFVEEGGLTDGVSVKEQLGKHGNWRV